MGDRGLDPDALLGERAGELDERWQSAASGPRQPAVQELARLLGGQPVDLPQLLLEQIGAIQRLVGMLDARELGLLAGGEVLGVLPQREPGALEVLGELPLPGPARFVSDLAADDVPALRSRA